MLLPKKLKFFVNYFLGPILFVGIAISIYQQILQQDHSTEKWKAVVYSLQGQSAWKLYAAIALVFLNWGIEAKKWQILLQHLLPVGFWQALKSVVSGVAFTMVTPNRVGEFIGRVFYVPDGNRIRAAALTLVSSTSQLIVTLLAGSIGLAVLRAYLLDHMSGISGLSMLWINVLLAGTLIILSLMLLVYFRISWLIKIIDKIPQFAKYAYFIQPLEEIETREFGKILFLSAFRYIVFVWQYWLMFKLFNVQLLSWELISIVTVLFLVLATVPTIAMAELGIRTKVSIVLFGIFSNNTIGILVATGTIWLINIIFPAIIGSLFVLSVKLFSK